MSKTPIIATVAALVLAGIPVTSMVAPAETVIGTDATQGSIQSPMQIHDLHVAHPHMKDLPVQPAPLP